MKTACDYVHLNLVRARLLPAESPLKAYAWSSFPEYLRSAARRRAWLRVDRPLGAHGIPKDSSAGFARGAVHILFLNAEGTVKSLNKIAHVTQGGPNLSDADHFGCGVAALGDLNGDGKPDLVVGNNGFYYTIINYDYDNVTVLLGNGDGTFRPPVAFVAGNQPLSVAVGDFNADGKPDIAVGREYAASVLLNSCGSAGFDLTLVRRGAGLNLSWPFVSTGFVLESATSLSPANWQPAAESPVTNNGRLEVSLPAKGWTHVRMQRTVPVTEGGFELRGFGFPGLDEFSNFHLVVLIVEPGRADADLTGGRELVTHVS